MNSRKCTAAVKTISTAVCFALTSQTKLFLLLNWVKRPTSTHITNLTSKLLLFESTQSTKQTLLTIGGSYVVAGHQQSELMMAMVAQHVLALKQSH